MARRSRPFRVAVFGQYRTDHLYAIIRGVIEYVEHARNWQLIGVDGQPFMPFDQVDLTSIDGVIGAFFDLDWAETVKRDDVPAVNISNLIADLPLPRVGSDDEAIGRMGAAHLLERGFSNLGFVGYGNAWFSQRRLAGFRTWIEQKAGRTCLVCDGLSHQSHDCQQTISNWLRQVPKPIAVMTAVDHLGYQVIAAAGALGLRVPHDVAVLGVDNDRWAMVLSSLPMSSVQTHGRQIGYQAAQLLGRLMARKSAPPPQWVPPVGVVTRKSTEIELYDDQVVVDALHFIREHCDEAITVEDVLDHLYISRRNLETRLKRAVGLTPHAAISQARIERAKSLLTISDAPLHEIARDCGFDRQDHFCIVFKRLTGMTPGRFRQERGLRREG
ncbi:MAG: helix-turn-helix domain-containing protein [Phycisphaera sp.]|nr:helix-turn-helix domain-containing protein [Phycisphaera sp.]